MQLEESYLFVHVSTQDGKVTLSVCTGCLKAIAYSPEPQMLLIAEKAHRCPGRQPAGLRQH